MQAMPVQPAAWPAITETGLHAGILADGTRIGFWFPVKAADGRPLYLFSCDGGSASYLGSLSTDSINYVPDMMCLLSEVQLSGRSGSRRCIDAVDTPA